MKLNKGNKRGISLIVLVITIIVMIILAAAIILSLNSSGIIGKANKAKLSADKANMLEAAGVAYAEYQLEKQMGELNPANQTAEDYVKDKLKEQFTADTLNQLSVLSDGTIQILPTIPTGFVVSQIVGEQKISEGLVIYELKANEDEEDINWTETDTTTVAGQTLLKVQTERNQYVWVPVPDMGQFKLISWENWMEESFEEDYIEPPRAEIVSPDDISNYADEIAQYNAMKASVEANGGFYIARYEAGLPDGKTAENVKIDGTDKPVSKKGATIWNNIAWDSSFNNTGCGVDQNAGAAKVSKSLINSNSNVLSHLIYGVQWDAALNFMQDSEHSVTKSSTWGNYSDYNDTVEESKQVVGAGEEIVKSAGFSENWKAKNMY